MSPVLFRTGPILGLFCRTAPLHVKKTVVVDITG